MIQSLAVALSTKIQCNAICPASFYPAETGQSKAIADAKREIHQKGVIISKGIKVHKGTPEEVAELVVYLCGCSDYLNGAVIPLDGGKHII
jgi:NAD(P)-dependent dehydrogenase (short-subunit alcohol dehydrogenase family)